MKLNYNKYISKFIKEPVKGILRGSRANSAIVNKGVFVSSVQCDDCNIFVQIKPEWQEVKCPCCCNSIDLMENINLLEK